MDFLTVVWTLITSHWHDVTTIFFGIKPVADTIDSVKKVLPELASKKTTQEYLEKSAELLNDKDISIEEKEWELNTRQELAKSMVHITAIEAAYQVARGAIALIFFAISMHYWARFFIRRKAS